MEKIAAESKRFEEMFGGLDCEEPSGQIETAWRDYHDPAAAGYYLIIKIERFRRKLTGFRRNGTEKHEYEARKAILQEESIGIANAVGILAVVDKSRAVSVIADLLADCLECEYTVVFSKCVSVLMELGPLSLEEVIRKYEFYRIFSSNRGVWLEILARLGVRDARIRVIIEEHLKLNRYEAVLAMGDYRDAYFIPALKRIVNSTADRLRRNRIDPFEKNVRVWNRDADIYIEARSVLVELVHNVSVRTGEYYDLVTETDTKLLPHADTGGHHLRRMNLREEIRVSGGKGPEGGFGSPVVDHCSRESFLYICLFRAMHDLPVDKNIDFMIGFLRGAASLRDRTVISCLMEDICGGRDTFDDEKHYEEAIDALASVYDYFTQCYDNHEPGGRVWKDSACVPVNEDSRSRSFCNEISGYIEGVKTGLTDTVKSKTQVSSEFCLGILDLYKWLDNVVQEKYASKVSLISAADDSKLDGLFDEFYRLTMNTGRLQSVRQSENVPAGA
ncbi:MAG: hypothetical protein H8E46_10785 [FCB group bacterium]|nr:hypothetical protein [FCB group bacterium]